MSLVERSFINYCVPFSEGPLLEVSLTTLHIHVLHIVYMCYTRIQNINIIVATVPYVKLDFHDKRLLIGTVYMFLCMQFM